MKPLATVILAAGASQRFGGIKQLADIQGKYMLQHVLDNCQMLHNADLFLLLGANRRIIQNSLQTTDTQIIYNPDWPKGIGFSIRTATRKLHNNYAGILFIAGDQPWVSGAQLTALTELWHSTPEKICAAQYAKNIGIPALFPAPFYPELMKLEADFGAKKLLLAHRDKIGTLDIPQAALDIDWPEDIVDNT